MKSSLESCQNFLPKKVNVGDTHKCYIPGCEREVFAWEWDIKDKKTGGILMIVLGSIFLVGFLSALCAALIKNAYD